MTLTLYFVYRISQLPRGYSKSHFQWDDFCGSSKQKKKLVLLEVSLLLQPYQPQHTEMDSNSMKPNEYLIQKCHSCFASLNTKSMRFCNKKF